VAGAVVVAAGVQADNNMLAKAMIEKTIVASRWGFLDILLSP
jgi:hypothetical protein